MSTNAVIRLGTADASRYVAEMARAGKAAERLASQSQAAEGSLDRLADRLARFSGRAFASSADGITQAALAMRQALAEAERGSGAAMPSAVGLLARRFPVVQAGRVAASAMHATYEGVRDVAGIQAESERNMAGLQAANGGDSQAAAKDMEFLRQSAERLGLDLSASTEAYVRLAGAASDTSLAGAQTREVFTAMGEAATVLGLSSNETGSILGELQSMLLRGTVHADDFAGTLGGLLPGAFQTAARAMGVTKEELDTMLASGELLADEFLPRFAAQIRQDYAGAIEVATNSATAALGRSDSAWRDLRNTVVASGLGEFAAKQLNILSDGMNGISQAMRRAKTEGSGFWGQMASGFGALLKFASPVHLLGYTPQSDQNRLVEIRKEIARYEPHEDVDRGARNRLAALRRQELELERLLSANEPPPVVPVASAVPVRVPVVPLRSTPVPKRPAPAVATTRAEPPRAVAAEGGGGDIVRTFADESEAIEQARAECEREMKAGQEKETRTLQLHARTLRADLQARRHCIEKAGAETGLGGALGDPLVLREASAAAGSGAHTAPIDEQGSGLAGEDEYGKKREGLKVFLQEKKTLESEEQERSEEAQVGWLQGMKDGLSDYAKTAAAVSGDVAGVFGKAFKGMEDALMTFVQTGKLDFSSLADSIISDMVRIAIQQSVTGPLASMLGMAIGNSAFFNGGVSGLATANSVQAAGGDGLGSLIAANGWASGGVEWASGGFTGPGGKYEPAGIVHRGEGVLNQDDIRALGGEQGFNALRRAIRTGHTAGGMAGSPRLQAVGAPRMQPNIVINNTAPGVSVRTESISADEVRFMIQAEMAENTGAIAAREMDRLGSPLARSTSRRFNIQPRR